MREREEEKNLLLHTVNSVSLFRFSTTKEENFEKSKRNRTKRLKSMSEKVRCLHLLVKHTESRNPVSRRTGEKITR